MPNLDEVRKEYMREYRKQNRERIRQKQREWRENNPDKVKEIYERFWMRKAKELQHNT
ncbi:hypothetical protein [Alkalihalobacterium alkalinitrilicum]|uniref:hypothetical protein n=1 Tax=Alkalihalobacterium alkalinitrilicum TaxID=427920 RepID=UPI001C56B599|nr:hypothetical protein [Alkalihalobacterium alkalinitrilicum]